MTVDMYLNLFLGITENFVYVYVIFEFLRHSVRHVRFKRRYYIAAYIGMTLVLAAAGIFTENTLLYLFVLAGGGAVIGYTLFHRDWIHVLHTVIFAVCMVALMAGTIAAGLWFTAKIDSQFTTVYISSNFILIMKMLVVIGGGRIIETILGRYRNVKYTLSQVFAFLFLICGSILFLVTIYLGTSYFFFWNPSGLLLFGGSSFLIVVLNVFLGRMLGIQGKNEQLKTELEMYRQQSKMQYEYYKDLEEKYNNSRKLIHDIRNHLHAVESLYHTEEDEAGSRYARDIHEKLNLLGQQYYCDNKMLNIILNDKLEKARNAAIQVKVQIGEFPSGVMKDIDLTTVFANLLDNAVIAAAGEEHAWILIKMEEVRSFLVVKIANSCRSKNSYMKSIRKEGSGIGQKNVITVLEKYNGTMEIKESDHTYEVHLVIPIEQRGDDQV